MVADGTHHTSVFVPPWHQGPVSRRLRNVSVICKQDATAYFTSASVTNSWPATCFLRCPKRYWSWSTLPAVAISRIGNDTRRHLPHVLRAPLDPSVSLFLVTNVLSYLTTRHSFSPQARFVSCTPRKHWTENVRRKRTDSRPTYSSCDPYPTGC